MRRSAAAWLVVLATLALPASALASVGVGVGTGRIVVNEHLRSGGIYKLPPITVFNTGTEKAVYTMSVTLNEKQPQLKPNPQWFSFAPRQFTLAPHQSQAVIPTFHPPVKTQPGKYFAYLEAHPDRTVKQGTTAVGVAAATKLSFSIDPSNIFYGIYYRVLGLYRQWEPWSQVVLIALAAAIILAIFDRFLLNLRAAFGAAWKAGRQREAKTEKSETKEKPKKKDNDNKKSKHKPKVRKIKVKSDED